MVRSEKLGATKMVAKFVDKTKKKYRFRESGHFMGKYHNKYDVIELYPKQAKYPLLSGQLEVVEDVSPIVPKMVEAPAETVRARRRRPSSEE